METASSDEQPRVRRADARRRHLLDTARSLFVERGFHQTGIAQIATQSGIKVGQIYRDFASKEAIIAAICEMDVTAWLEEDVLATAVAKGDVPAIRGWLTRFSRGEDSDEYRLVSEIMVEAGRNPRVAEIYRALDARLLTSLSAALAALVPDDTDPDAIHALAELIMTLGAGMASRRMVHGEAGSRAASRMIEQVVTCQVGALLEARSLPEDRGG